MKATPMREMSMWSCGCGTNVVVEAPSKAWLALHAATAAAAPTVDLLFGCIDVEYVHPVGALEIKSMACPCCGRPLSRVEPQKILASLEAGRAAFDAGEPLPRLEHKP
jgi:hypothetical protein